MIIPSTRHLAAILAADVAGDSRLMGADEEGTHERLKTHLRQLVDPKIKQHQGRIVKNPGDGMLVEFPSVVDAMRCATEVQRGMIDREPDVTVERRIKFRMGINLGDVILDGGDIFGDGVNVAARLEALAEPGGICVSRTVRDQIRDRLPYSLDDMGEQSVKNIARPVRVYTLRPEAVAELPSTSAPTSAPRQRRGTVLAIAAAVAAALVIGVSVWWMWPGMRSASTVPMASAPTATSISQPVVAPRLSIVVLPFVNLNSDPDQQYFADGITEDLTTDLSRFPNWLVISRNTAFTYKDKPTDAKQIGRELGVRYVLEGSVQRASKQIRINIQLIDAETDTHLWAERFDRDSGDLLALQNEITTRIANALRVELIGAEAARMIEQPEVIDYIMRGRALAFGKRPARDVYAERISMFERALALDPNSAAAQSYLAIALAGRVLDQLTDNATADIGRAEGLAGQALAASPRSNLAHWAKAQVLRAQGRCEEAIPEFESATASNNPNVGLIAALGECKFYTGSI